jgi:cytosine/adenosine deaminase-related metal-dependent hydrolase
VLIEVDRIREVGDAKTLQRDHPEANTIDFGDSMILPGLINAHTHLELSAFQRPPAPYAFVPWVQQLVDQHTSDPTISFTGVMDGVRQSTKFGVTCLGDVSAQLAPVRTMLPQFTSQRLVSFGEVRAMATRRNLLDERLAAALDPAGSSCRIGISPHAPYSIEPTGYRRCLAAARERGLPLQTHLAETRDEERFLADHTGPLRDLWDYIGGWDNDVPTFAGGPIRYAETLGVLDYEGTSLAHVNYCDDAELEILAHGKASVVYCPRTHRYFGHPPHRWREMLAAGINVAVGTDSAASSPDLNVVDDLRLLHEIAPHHPVEELWQMATARAAMALQWDDEIGSIAAGKSADFTIFNVSTNDPLREVLEDPTRLPGQVWIKGNPVSPC